MTLNLEDELESILFGLGVAIGFWWFASYQLGNPQFATIFHLILIISWIVIAILYVGVKYKKRKSKRC